jgi:capsular polysaccharide biosynthesis protein
MRVELKPLFGEIPSNADNLEIVGSFPNRYEVWPNVTVWPGSGVLRQDDGTIVPETIWTGKNLEQCGDYHSGWSRFPRRQRGCFFNVSLFWWQNYYHWICDVLVRLRRALGHFNEGTRIILPPGLTAWQRRSLELIRLPFDKSVHYSGKRPWKVERLIYVPPVAMTGDHERESLLLLRQAIWENLDCTPAKPGWRKIYLTRKNAPSRRIVNEDELLPLLRERGFEVVDCGTLSFDEQVKLFSEARYVVGPHGASLTNIVWAPAGAKVFEIFEPGSVRRCYWSMCQALGHDHACGVGRPVEQKGGESDIEVPAKLLVQSWDESFAAGQAQ